MIKKKIFFLSSNSFRGRHEELLTQSLLKKYEQKSTKGGKEREIL